MSTASWGKQAMDRIGQSQFEHDELLQQLGTQFDFVFTDYDKWGRIMKSRPSVKEAEIALLKQAAEAESHWHELMTYRQKREHAKHKEEEKERSERRMILELRIKTKKQTLNEYEKRYAELIEQNFLMRHEIKSKESHTLDHVKGLQRRYEKYRSGIAILSHHFDSEYQQALDGLAVFKVEFKLKKEVLEHEVEAVNIKLEQKQKELYMLLHYKDREYRVKALKISDLLKELETLEFSNEEELAELEHITESELNKYKKKKQSPMTMEITERAMKLMHPSLKELAFQNLVMKKEIEFHKKQQKEIQKSNIALEETIKQLSQDSKGNLRLQMFPEIFQYRNKCTPDMDVKLDIPLQQWLPI